MFQIQTQRVLPNGEFATVYPFHVCTEGQEERVIFRDEEDLRVGFNSIPICASRANVIVVVGIVLNSHIHSVILARSYEDALTFIDGYKISIGKYIQKRYGINCVYRDVDAKPIFLDSPKYVRNAICYTLRNALDMGKNIHEYRWSGYRGLFCGGIVSVKCHRVSEMKYRELREMFKASTLNPGINWLVSEDGVIEPASFMDWKYAEAAFGNDLKFFLKVLGFSDDEEMKQLLEINPFKSHSVEEILAELESRARQIHGLPLNALTKAQKIPVAKKVYHSMKVSRPMLAKCLGVPLSTLLQMLGLAPCAPTLKKPR